MKKVRYLLLILGFLIANIPLNVFADDDYTVDDFSANILCKKDSSSISDGESLEKGDEITCDFIFGLTDSAKNKTVDYSLNYTFDTTSGKISTEKLTAKDRPSNVDSDGSITREIGTASGDTITVVRNYKFEVDGDNGDEAKLNFSVKYTIKGVDDDENEKLNLGAKTYNKTISFNISDPSIVPVELSNLSLSGMNLSPAFSKNIYSYTATTTNDSVKINASADDSLTITGDGDKSLNIGNNEFKITVSNGTNSQTYTINITRNEIEEPKSSNSSLSSLKINGENIPLKSGIYEYITYVSNSTTYVSVIASPSDSGATTNVSGNTNLQEGNNVVTVLVTAPDGSTSTYKITVVRNVAGPVTGLNIPISIIFLGIVGGVVYFKVRKKNYLPKI